MTIWSTATVIISILEEQRNLLSNLFSFKAQVQSPVFSDILGALGIPLGTTCS